MAKANNNKQAEGKSSHHKGGMTFSTPAAAVVGAVIGAAAGYALSKRETRERIKEVIDDIQTRSSDIKDTLSEQATQVKDQAMKTTQGLMEKSQMERGRDSEKSADRSSRQSQK